MKISLLNSASVNSYILCLLLFPAILFACNSDDNITTDDTSDDDDITDNMDDDDSDDDGDEFDITEILEAHDGSGMGTARDISSFDLVAEMGVGWNLGNSFDVTSKDKTLWGNPLPSKDIIDDVREMGFTTIRIPVTWGYDQNETDPYTIDPNYLIRVRNVVNYAFQNGMHVIINVHHDNDWVVPSASNAAETEARLGSLWTQVSEYFIEYNDSLIFETLNEPRIEGIPEEWSGGTAAGRGYINDFHKVAVDAIRATGGNNSLRHIMIPTWAASTVDAAMNDLEIPNNDEKIIISLHTYFPWAYAGEASINWGSDQDKADLEAELERVYQKWVVQEQRPVILGEWGTVEENSTESRLDYYEFYARNAAERGLLTVVWDDGGRFRLYNRHALRWDFQSLAEVIVSASDVD
ncbi:MAG: glycoside hydrolase family 5 protein [bacterium]|nr:glycoside hydrolase family 5 protein [bacterium]